MFITQQNSKKPSSNQMKPASKKIQLHENGDPLKSAATTKPSIRGWCSRRSYFGLLCCFVSQESTGALIQEAELKTRQWWNNNRMNLERICSPPPKMTIRFSSYRSSFITEYRWTILLLGAAKLADSSQLCRESSSSLGCVKGFFFCFF